MKKLTIIFAAIAICFGITTNTFAQAVTAEFKDNGADGTTLNRVRMDNPLVPYSNGVDGVSAAFYTGASTSSRDLIIRLDGSKTRTMVFDFSEISSYKNVPAWVYSSPLQYFKPQMNILGAYYAKEKCMPNTDGSCENNFVTRVNAGYLYTSGDKARYSLLWNPETINNRPVNSPEYTSLVTVNYRKDASGNEVYTITPLPNCATRANLTCENVKDANGNPVVKRVIAGLEKASTSGTLTSAGQYVMPFTLVVRPK
jgi:hypothetical protein